MPAVLPAGQKFLFIFQGTASIRLYQHTAGTEGGMIILRETRLKTSVHKRVACLQDSLLCTVTLKLERKCVSRGNHNPLCPCVRHHHRMEASSVS